MKPKTTGTRKTKDKMGHPMPTIMTPIGELSLAEAAQLEREGRYPGREKKNDC